jgi:molybdopterin-guanine dinucleotide biosynthesis protein
MLMGLKQFSLILSGSENINIMKSTDSFQLKPGQQKAFNRLKLFVAKPSKGIFILKGYAGTGKSTLIRELIEELKRKERRFSLMASTGRAAKIVSNISGCDSRTVHSQIYTFQELNQDIETIVKNRDASGIDRSGQLLLNFDLVTVDNYTDDPRIYIVDEASMISDKEDPNAIQAVFGSGKLLTDLLTYDKNGKFIFVGDECQLPPVTQSSSPALDDHYLKRSFDFPVEEFVLTEIVRQASDNDIIMASKKLRDLYLSPPAMKWAKFPMLGYKNIKVLPDQATLLKNYVNNIRENGFNHSTFICFSNNSCDTITSLIRPMLGINQTTVQVGDLLLVTQNNYISGLMNGDLVRVEEVGTREKRAGLTFVKISVKELFTSKIYSQLMIENILYSVRTNLVQSEQKELYVDFYIRMKAKGIHQKSPFFNKYMMSDPYLNALRAVFGFALTCHKSQGGEWEQVYLDIAKNVPAITKPYVYQWVYTAMTRAKVQLNIVDNWWIE